MNQGIVIIRLDENGRVTINAQGFSIHETVGLLDEAHTSMRRLAIGEAEVVETEKNSEGVWEKVEEGVEPQGADDDGAANGEVIEDSSQA